MHLSQWLIRLSVPSYGAMNTELIVFVTGDAERGCGNIPDSPTGVGSAQEVQKPIESDVALSQMLAAFRIAYFIVTNDYFLTRNLGKMNPSMKHNNKLSAAL